MNGEYKVTAIIPAYNAEKYIEETILSVLGQTEKCKMIIVNDASKDETLEIAKRYQKQYPEQICIIDKKQNEGVSEARNSGIRQADTEYVAFLDADDWWSKEKTEIQLARMAETGADLCYTGRELMSAEGESTGKLVSVPSSVDYKTLLLGNVIPCSSVMVKREVALQYPWKHDELHEDYIVWLSMLRDKRSVAGIDQPCLKSRLGEGGKSRNKWKSAMMTYQVYRHIGLSVPKALWCFVNYAVNGIKKYN